MFGFLKDKLKKITEVFTKATTEEEKKPAKAIEKKAPPKKPAKKEIKKPISKSKAKPEPKKKTKPQKKEKIIDEPEEEIEEVTEEPREEITEEQEEIEEPQEKIEEDEEKIPTKNEPIAEEKKEEPEKKSFLDRLFGKKKETTPEEKTPPVKTEKKTEEKKTVKTPPAEEPSGFFGKLKAAIVTKKLERTEYDKIFEEIEIDLLENNVALDVVDKIKEDLWIGISTERFNRFAPEKRVQAALTQSISELFIEPFDILEAARSKVIYVICAIGINGSGKTTTLAKLAQYFKDNNLEPVLAAGDTFRAAAIQQLEEHANKIGVKLIKQQYGADSAAVAFDAIQYAKANKCRVVLVDTAGRLHSNTNLMEEMKKIIRVARPDATIFIGEATTGNDCVEQAVQFQAAVPIDGIVLSKVDVDERGGAALSISYVTKKPILFFGTGQTYKDLEPFDREKIVTSLTIE